MKLIYKYSVLIIAIFCLALTSCRDDEFGDTIFDPNVPSLDKSAYTYKLDSFLYYNYLVKYNLQFRYKMQDVGTDLNYNLVPATYTKSKEIAVLAKYLWFDVYDKVAGTDFLKENGAKVIHLIGSPAYNPTSGTILLGLAEGGIKISLFRVNDLNVNSVDDLNEMYFKTMHHEFAHILHQKKLYPKDFKLISSTNYNPLGWQDRHENITLSLGFASPYGGSQVREDWVEIIANYIVKTDAWWLNAFDIASRGWKQVDKTDPSKGVEEIVDADGVDGAAILNLKIEMCKTWMQDKWNIDLDALRYEVQYRQAHINLNELLQQVN